MREIDCLFRYGVRHDGEREVATCGLVQQVTGCDDDAVCVVDRDACLACSEWFADSLGLMNPVIPSLIYRVCDSLDQHADPARLASLGQYAEACLAGNDFPTRPSIHSCDLIVCCDESSPQAAAAIESALAQQQVQAVVHIVDDGGGGQQLVEQFSSHMNVVTHRNHQRQGTWATLHDLVPHCRTPFIAVADPHSVSRPLRMAESLRVLDELGAEIAASAIQTPRGIVAANRPGQTYRRDIPPQTLVFRRATLVDMQGISDRVEDADAELVYRACQEGRRLVLIEDPLVDCPAAWQPGTVGDPPQYEPGARSLGKHARGFATEQVECDVVLPFYGQLEFVEEALASVVDQERSETVVHLIDDATPADTSPFLRRWQTHPRVRAYRNRQNIGQFASFNNVFPYLETGLVAVQDGDDISLPQRLHTAGNQLRLSQSDLFGAAVTFFGADNLVVPARGGLDKSTEVARGRGRESMYPRGKHVDYYLENPTLVMRAATFAALGGYADYGDRIRNRTGLDTEFLIRAYFAGARVAVSRDVLVKYRVHAASATQDNVSGWGTAARSASQIEAQRRRQLYRRGWFDPRAFGGLENHRGLTERL